MVYTRSAPSSDPENSFPHSMSSAETADEGSSDEIVPAVGLASPMVESTPSASLTDGASAQSSSQDLVQVQCWGSGIQGDFKFSSLHAA